MNPRLRSLLVSGLMIAALAARAPADPPWPPPLPGAVNGTATLRTADFLKVPPEVEARRQTNGAAPFVVAAEPPTVELAYHGDLPNAALNGTGWSAWGDICAASDGRVYSGIGDHGRNEGGSYTFIYCWDPATKTLRQIVDVNKAAGAQAGDPTWSKVHARICEGADGGIYFTPTLNDGSRAGKTAWTPRIPGGQIFRYDPASGSTTIVGSYEGEVTATTLMDTNRNLFYAYLEGQGAALAAFDVAARRRVYTSPHDAVSSTRNFALARDGRIFFNGKAGIWCYNPETRSIAPTKSALPEGAELRSSTAESRDGFIYGTSFKNKAVLFRYAPASDTLEVLGPDFLTGDYTTVTVLSPDERFVYYLPGAHGGATKIGTPVVQYDIAARRQKVLAFLREPVEKALGYVPAGTYGVKISADGSTLYVNFNGHARDDLRPEPMKPTGFGLTAFAAIHIPASER